MYAKADFFGFKGLIFLCLKVLNYVLLHCLICMNCTVTVQNYVYSMCAQHGKMHKIR